MVWYLPIFLFSLNFHYKALDPNTNIRATIAKDQFYVKRCLVKKKHSRTIYQNMVLGIMNIYDGTPSNNNERHSTFLHLDFSAIIFFLHKKVLFDLHSSQTIIFTASIQLFFLNIACNNTTYKPKPFMHFILKINLAILTVDGSTLMLNKVIVFY